jgi:hypothetical protein
MTDIEELLMRSVQLDLAALDILAPQDYRLYEDSAQLVACFNACEVALEHARALRTLISEGFDTTAASIMRLQFEALVRAMWLLWAATPEQVALLSAPLSTDAEKAAKDLPMVSDMIKALKTKGQPGAYAMVEEFRATMLPALNSFVHSGIHAIQRHSFGYPERLMADILRNSNGLFTMTTMMLATLSGDDQIISPMRIIARDFADCLPTLIKPPGPDQSSSP